MNPLPTLRRRLVALHGPGWKVTREGPIITATRGRSRLEYAIRFNGGSPAWFCVGACPWNITRPDLRGASTEPA
jgi:hypothetical protein